MSNNISQSNIANDDVLVVPGARVIKPIKPIIVEDGQTINNATLSSGSVMSVLSGGIASGTDIESGGLMSVLSNGSAYGTLVDGGTQYVLSGAENDSAEIHNGAQYVIGGVDWDAKISATNISSIDHVVVSHYDHGLTLSVSYADISAVQYVSAGGVVNNATISDYMAQQYDAGAGVAQLTIGEAKQYVLDGGEVNDCSIAGGAQYISSGGVANNTDVSSGEINIHVGPTAWVGKQYIYDGGVANSTMIESAEQYIYAGGVASNTILYGSSFVSGGTTVNTSVYGTLYVDGGNVSGVTLINSGGCLSITSDGQINGDVTLNVGGSMTIGLSNGGSVDLVGNENSGLIISGYTAGSTISVTTEINNFSGLGATASDKVVIDGLKADNVSSVSYPDDNHIMLKLLDGKSLTLNMVGIKQAGYTLGSDSSGNLTMIVCFLSGTMIRVAKGVCAVEDLQIGDTVLTYDPQTKAKIKKKVTWVGKQTTRVNAKLPDDLAGYPVRILKDAFKKNVPNKDLLVTSEHCLFIDGYFIPARMLVNGRSIFYDYSITSYDYYHFETEDHSVIWADGMLTESYLNTGNRHAFNKDQKVIKLDPHVKIWAEDAVAPLMVERSFVESIFDSLAKRADKQQLPNQKDSNFTLSNDHGLYLLTEDGEEIYHNKVVNDKIIFILPANTQNIYLVSRKSRPCDVIGPFVDDRRYLGVLVGKVFVLNEYGAYPVVQYLQQDELPGWSGVEQSSHRWTMGCALLPLDVYNADYPFEIAIQIINAGPYLVEEENLDEEKIAV